MVHVGATTVDELTIHWPSGCVQTLHGVASNQIFTVVESCVITVAIDIKPGSFPNSINPKSKGKIPVAILTTDAFDATTVDPTTVLFGATGTAAAPVQSALEDVDGDSFNVQDTGIACGDTSASPHGSDFQRAGNRRV